MDKLPVGVEKVLYTAATDAAFRKALFEDRTQAVRSRALELRETELALLRAIPDAQLSGIIDSIDVSPENLERRGFLKTVALATATVVAVEGLSACSDSGGGTKGIRPDMPSDKDAGVEDGGQTDMVRPSMGIRPGG